MGIIRQPAVLFAVPDFRNLGVILRIFFSVSILVLLTPVLRSDFERYYVENVLAASSWIAPFVIITVTSLVLCNRWLMANRYGIFLTWGVSLLSFVFCAKIFEFPRQYWLIDMLLVSIYMWGLMHYQGLLEKSLSPALSEAKLAALTARIRPHFLFNSLNAAIALVRTRPIDAEMVLENLADLFRAQLKDSNQSSSLGREIELAQGYLEIETIRMGAERLKSTWTVDAPEHAEVPHLLLQPLLENAVYHGIETSHRPGEIMVNIRMQKDWIYIRIDNPIPENPIPHKRKGNQMAMGNLAERLHLMYDADAVLKTGKQGHFFRVDIRLPYRKALPRYKPHDI